MFSDVFMQGLGASIMAGSVTGIGGLLIFFKKRYSRDNINIMLNIAAGIMMSASFFSLLSPALYAIMKFDECKSIAGLWFVGAIFAGVALVWLLNALLPHEHNYIGQHGPHFHLKAAWLFIIAITIHKFPEGLAVGVAYSGENITNPDSLTIGIALQNIPEGLTVAISLVAVGYSKWKAAFCSLMTGMVQPIGAIAGLLTMQLSDKIVPLGMALAGGTLLFVIVNEILPETYDTKKSQKAAFAVFLGFICMTYISVVLD